MTSNLNHSPTPWSFDGVDVLDADGRPIAGVQLYGNGHQRETTENLFLAAPDMYDALVKLKCVVEILWPDSRINKQLGEIIAKAEG